MKPRFVATPAALTVIRASGQAADAFLDRHWQSVHRIDRYADDHALSTRLLSVHQTVRGRWVCIISEADRSITTIMLPAELPGKLSTVSIPPKPAPRTLENPTLTTTQGAHGHA